MVFGNLTRMLAAAAGERDGSILAAVFESGCGARNDNQRTFQIGAAIPQRAIASITKRKIPSSPWRLSLLTVPGVGDTQQACYRVRGSFPLDVDGWASNRSRKIE